MQLEFDLIGTLLKIDGCQIQHELNGMIFMLNNRLRPLAKLFVRLLLSLTTSLLSTGKSTADVDSDTNAQHPLLNSERIKAEFGNYGVTVLSQNNLIRVSNLYSSAGDHRTTRTLAVVFYPEDIAKDLRKNHEKIVLGGSLGQIFKDDGWSINKHHLYFGSIEPKKEYARLYQMMSTAYCSLAIDIYQFTVSKEGKKFVYVTIAEIYHPQYLTIEKLKKMHLKDYIANSQLNDNTKQLLAATKVKLGDLPKE